MSLIIKKVAVGSDHAGFHMKEHIKATLKSLDIELIDFGTDNGEKSVDYPDFGEKVAQHVANHKDCLGILTCGSGIGISIAANKVRGIRAALCYDETAARLSREHNNANILVIPGRPFTPEKAEMASKMLTTWLSTEFAGGRHQNRIDKIAAIEKRESEA